MINLDMVGVAGSSPVAPTKQNPVLLPVQKGPPRGGPFLLSEKSILGVFWAIVGKTILRTGFSSLPQSSCTPTLPGRALQDSAQSFSQLLNSSRACFFVGIANPHTSIVGRL